jgi:hypothetical protein
MAAEGIGTYLMAAGCGVLLAIKVSGIRRVVGLFVVLVLVAFALCLKSLGAVTSGRRG